jgi:hypothetical protein
MNAPTPPLGVIAEKAIWLPRNVPSSKNNREIGYYFLKPTDTSNWFIKIGETFRKIRPTLRSSDRTEAYVKEIVDSLIANRRKFHELVKGFPKPYILQVHFVRDSKRSYDYINAYQILADCFSGHYWEKDKKIPLKAVQFIEDDDMANVVFIPVLANMLAGMPLYSVDKVSPGVWVMPLDIRPKTQPNDIFKGMPSESLMAEIPFPNPNAKFVEELRAIGNEKERLKNEGNPLTFPLIKRM